jgi:hypothetical protein
MHAFATAPSRQAMWSAPGGALAAPKLRRKDEEL